MSVRRSKRSAATAAENKIQAVIDDIDSDEESNTSTYREDSSRRPSSDDDAISSGNDNPSDEDFQENEPLRHTKAKKNGGKKKEVFKKVDNRKNKNPKKTVSKRSRDRVVEEPAPATSSSENTRLPSPPKEIIPAPPAFPCQESGCTSTFSSMTQLQYHHNSVHERQRPPPASTESDPVILETPANDEGYKELTDSALKSLMRSFRLTDLQTLVIFAGKNKAGRKTELLDRACELVDKTNGDAKKRLSEKIQELSTAMYKSISSAPSVNPYSANYQPNETSTPSTNDSQDSSFGGIPPLHLPSNGSSSRYDSGNSYHYNSYNTNHLMYPTYPDVKLRNLPFYKIEAVLMKPSSLQPKGLARFQEQTSSFHLTPTQASDCNRSQYRTTSGRSEFKQQIQLRFSLLETSCEQDDNFPSSVCVKVNGRLQTLPNPIPTNKPGVEPKRPPKPIDITALCKLSSTVPNFVNVTWAVEVGSGYTISVYYVEKLSSTDLMDELKKKGKRHSDYTRALIKDKLSDKDNEIATTSCKVSLACPLGKMRMTTPCRSSTCDHLQCFDASLYLMMNEKKPKWQCPVCNKSALYEDLLIDGYFTDVLTSKQLPHDEHEIVLQSDASWESLVPAKTKTEPEKEEKPVPIKTEEVQPEVVLTAAEKKRAKLNSLVNLLAKRPPSPQGIKEDRIKKAANVETLNLDDDDDDEPLAMPSTSRSLSTVSAKKSKEVDYVTLDSDDEEIIVPPSGEESLIEKCKSLIEKCKDERKERSKTISKQRKISDFFGESSGKRRRIEDDSDSASVSALTPLSVTPPPSGYDNSSVAPIGDPDIICLSD